MPRKARTKSSTGIYHVMLRGVNRQEIFFDEEDYLFFIRLLAHYKDLCGYQIFAYCIMGNHVHLLIRTGAVPLSTILKRIGSKFVYWYNMKYERTGHLFQDRFKSEPVESQRYFLTALRYILQNPVKAGMCRLPQHYKYSSAKAYFSSAQGLTDTAFAWSILGKTALRKFILEENDDTCLEVNDMPRRGISDAAAADMILEMFGTRTPLVKKAVDRQAFNMSISQLIAKGVSIRQLNRLSGISRKAIHRALRVTR